jgi:hypothetical protein
MHQADANVKRSVWSTGLAKFDDFVDHFFDVSKAVESVVGVFVKRL